MTDKRVAALRSVEIGLPDVAAAEAFYTQTWGLSVVARQGTSVYLRGTGADHHLLALHAQDKPEVLAVTFRATSATALDELAALAVQQGGTVLTPRAVVQEPGGGECVVLRDPQGRILRFVWGDVQHTDTAENKYKPIRLAHAVLNSHSVAAGLPFYENALGFKLSDRTRIMAFIRIPMVPSGDHHSIALADADNDCLNHIAFVMPDLDAVMKGGGRMKDAGYPIHWGPGRHGPGNNLFNYFLGPGDFAIEYTAEVSQVDDTYRTGQPEDWKWPPGRIDHWGISAMPSVELKAAQRKISFAATLKV